MYFIPLTPLPRKEIKINTKNQGVLNILTCRNLNILWINIHDLKNSFVNWKWMVEPTVKANVICITANINFLSIWHCFPLDSVVTCFAEVRALNRPPQEDLNFCIIPRGTGHDAVYVLLQKQYQRLQESNCTGICQRSFMW